FYPSSDNDTCDIKHYDSKARYYYAEVIVHKSSSSNWCVIFQNNGLECKGQGISTQEDIFYKAWFNRLYAGRTYVAGTGPTGVGSHIRIWRTVCGEF
ncbi:unnamed protein product, partial [marine sediment metagenome]